MATKDELQARLAELEAARHKLLVGGRVESVDSPAGDNVKFANVSLKDLDDAIERTKRELSTLDGRGPRPIYVAFSSRC